MRLFLFGNSNWATSKRRKMEVPRTEHSSGAPADARGQLTSKSAVVILITRPLGQNRSKAPLFWSTGEPEKNVLIWQFFLKSDLGNSPILLYRYVLLESNRGVNPSDRPNNTAVRSARLGSTPMITEGKYSVWFRTSSRGGRRHRGAWPEWHAERRRHLVLLLGTLEARGRPLHGQPHLRAICVRSTRGVRNGCGRYTVTGQAIGDVAGSCTGFAKQAPSLKLDVTLVRRRDD